MPVTKSWTDKTIAPPVERIAAPIRRRSELPWLVAASLLVGTGLWLLFTAKTQAIPDVESKLARNELLNLNAVTSADQLEPFLRLQDPVQRRELAARSYAVLEKAQPLRNVGALSKLRRQGLPLAKLKPLFIVRTPREFRNEFLKWSAIYLASF